MRAFPTRYLLPKPAQVKKAVSQVAHVSAPLKGLSLSSKLTTGDPLTATILQNFVIEEDRISARAGFTRIMSHPDAKPIAHLIPVYTLPAKLAAATNHTLADAFSGALIQGGFTSDDWHWTSFANLGQEKFTVMVNGADGVWSWNGGTVPPSPTIPIVTMTKTNPAVVTVGAADIAYLHEGATVKIAGATGSWAAANGYHKATSVNSPVNTFTLPGVDLSAATGTQPAGMTVIVAGSIEPELIGAPVDSPWIVPAQFQIVLSHMNRLWFADNTNLAVYYLPVQQKSGEVKVLPLNALFRRGGSIRAMYTWTLEGGMGLNDQLVIFSTNGEAVIFQGTDPDDINNWQLSGIFRFDAPMSKHACINYGGDLYVMISTGVVPLSTLLRAESEQLGVTDKNVLSLFLAQSIAFRDRAGWQLMLNPSSGRLICNMPKGAQNSYRQMIRHMPRPVWSHWENIPSRCWAWIEPNVYFGDDKGNVYRMHPSIQNDNGKQIVVDLQMAWSAYKSPAVKQFKMVQAFITTDGAWKPLLDVKVNYDYTLPVNQPEITLPENLAAIWDVAEWDKGEWDIDITKPRMLWTGVAALGQVGAVRLRAAIQDCTFEVSGFDVLYETGAVFG